MRMQYRSEQILYTGCAVNGMEAAKNESEAIDMNNMLLIPMHSISTLIAEDASTPELRHPLAYVRKSNRKSGMQKHRMNGITEWGFIEKLFCGKRSVVG